MLLERQLEQRGEQFVQILPLRERPSLHLGQFYLLHYLQLIGQL